MPTHFTDWGEIWHITVNMWQALPWHTSPWLVYTFAPCSEKTAEIAQIWPNFKLLPCPPLHPSAPDLTCKSRSMVFSSMPDFIRIGSSCYPWVAEKPEFYHIFNILWWRRTYKVECRCTTTIFPYQSPYWNAFVAMSSAHTLLFKSMPDEHAHKREASSFFAPGSIQSVSLTILAWW